jgi:molybdopterin molybdotransferase
MFISYETSMHHLASLDVGSLRSEKVFLSDALNRVLAEDVVAGYNSPAYETSGMDGYAIQAADQAAGKIRVLKDNPAGSEIDDEVTSGVAIKTFTGSLMPKGSDTLIPIENVSVEGEYIVINEPVKEGFSVRPVGENFYAGDLLIKAGTTLGFAQIGVMASLNIVMAKVVKKPDVAILSTGSEVLDLGEEATNKAQIRSSNNYTLSALATAHGANAIQLGTCKDDKETILKEITNGLATSDILVTTGGVSVGDYDFVKEVVEKVGAKVIFKGVKIKPGQHILVAQKDHKIILGLPGFAYSSTVTFILYALPLIRRFLGLSEQPEVVDAILDEPFVKRSKKSEFSVCNLVVKDGQYHVNFEGKKVGTSAILTNMLGDNTALVMTGEEDSSLAKGEVIKVMKL